jgi:hypothetical protein
MMDEQLTQSQTIEGLRRQVESSNTSAQQAQALLRANQEQQQRMPPPNTSSSSGARGAIGSTPLIQPVSTPSTGFRTRELHGPGYYHIGSPADQGYAEHMRAGMIWIHLDKSHQDKSNSRWVPPHAGRVVNILIRV